MLGNKKSVFFLFLFFVISTVTSFAQSVEGTVVDVITKEPIIGATIQVKGTSIGTISDSDGHFKLNVNDKNATLHVSYIGYKDQLISLKGKSSFLISLEEDMQLVDEVVVIGYGVQRKSDLTGAVSSIKTEDIASSPVTNVVQALQGKAAGVEVVQNSGAPGSGSSIRIRGMGTINDSNPLYVVDGIPMDNIDYLSSDDIASIEILKDASSSAIYGSRAANGVVLIVTKSGKDSKKLFNVNVNTYVGWQQSWKDPGVMDKEDFAYYADFVNDMYIVTQKNPDNGGLEIKPETREVIEKGVNWWDELSRVAMMQKYNLSVYGGTDKLNYYVSGNFLKSEGIIKESQYDRKSFNAKFNAKLLPTLSLGTNLTYANENRNVVGEGTWGVIKSAINYNPLTPIYDLDFNYNWSTPVENLRRTTYESYNNSFVGQITLDWDIIKGLRFSTRASLSSYSSDQEQFNRYNINPEIVGNIRYDVKRSPATTNNISWDNILNYTGTWGDHNLAVMAGQTLETSKYNKIWGQGVGYGGYDSDYNALNFAQFSQALSGYSATWKAIGLLGRLSYSFKERYLLQANFRADASSRFAKQNRWGIFPSVSVGWKINSESFMKDIEWISMLKLRAGWGQLGNNRIGNYAYGTYVGNSSYTYIYGVGMPSIKPGMSITQYGNPDIKWERTQSTSVGLDFNLFGNRITSSFDFFVKDTHDMLIGVPIVYSSGYSSTPMQNAGSVRNGGYEIQLAYKDRIGNVNFEISGNFTQVKNEVKSLGQSGEPIYGGNLGSPNNLGYINKTVVGAPIGCFYGWKTAGIMTKDDFKSDGSPKIPVFASGSTYTPGDMKFVDINRDGVIDDNDRTFIGSPHPDFYYGFNVNCEYKGFELSMFFQGVYGNDIYNVTKYFGYSNVTYGGDWSANNALNYSNVQNDYFDKVWRPAPDPENPSYRDYWGANLGGTVPLPSSDGTKNEMNFRNSDFYIEDGSYLRLKNIQIAYKFPVALCKRMHINNLKVYASGTNLFTITKYEGLDPEVGKTIGQEGNNLYLGIDQGIYPQAKSYMFGVILDF